MKKIFTIIALSLFSIFSFAQKSLPDVEVKNLKGESYNIRNILDDDMPVILSFWYTTCKPCLQELGTLNDLYSEWIEEAEFKVVAVAIDDARSCSKVAPMVNGRGWMDFMFLLDENGDLKRAMNVQAPPVIFLLDKNGDIVYTHIGYTPGNEEELFEQILKIQ